MKTVKTNGIENYNLVATFNADPFFVENEEMMAEVKNALGEYAERYDSNDEEFTELAEKLDGNADTFSYIYVSNGVTVGVLQDKANTMWIIRDREAGNVIDFFATKEEAEQALVSYEQWDRENGIYSEDFYEIVERI